jgi:hypothetical protein
LSIHHFLDWEDYVILLTKVYFFADCIEQAVSEPTVHVDNDTGEATVNPGLDFQPGGFTIIGLFNCQDQETCVPGTGQNGQGRNHGAYLT